MFLKSVIYKIIPSSIQAIMHVSIFLNSIDIHRFFDGIEAVAPTNRTTIPEEQTEKQACNFFHNRKPIQESYLKSQAFHKMNINNSFQVSTRKLS